ncbi:MAG: hypothetical protein AAGB01_04020 [Cyanobacteria bacterium P01_F01_bin.42]
MAVITATEKAMAPAPATATEKAMAPAPATATEKTIAAAPVTTTEKAIAPAPAITTRPFRRSKKKNTTITANVTHPLIWFSKLLESKSSEITKLAYAARKPEIPDNSNEIRTNPEAQRRLSPASV